VLLPFHVILKMFGAIGFAYNFGSHLKNRSRMQRARRKSQFSYLEDFWGISFRSLFDIVTLLMDDPHDDVNGSFKSDVRIALETSPLNGILQESSFSQKANLMCDSRLASFGSRASVETINLILHSTYLWHKTTCNQKW